MSDASRPIYTRWIRALVLVACFVALTFTSANAQTTAWEYECASGEYVIVDGLHPAVTITCLEDEAPPPVTGDNQLVNPEFSGRHNATIIPGWNNVGATGGQYVISYNANRTKNATTTGYAVKWGPAKFHGEGLPGVNGMIEQVVPSQGRVLTAKITALHVRASVANYNVLARVDGGGWELVWRPFTIDNIPSLTGWHYLEAATVIGADYDEYKVQIESRWDSDNSLGVKWGDAYFGSE